jgi:hypothetical protein
MRGKLCDKLASIREINVVRAAVQGGLRDAIILSLIRSCAMNHQIRMQFPECGSKVGRIQIDPVPS